VILDVNYVGNIGRHFTFTRNLNQLRAGTRLSPPNSTINVNALRPYAGYANVLLRDNSDNSNYNNPSLMPAGRFGDGGRNNLLGPGFQNWDLSLLKSFQLREQARLQFRVLQHLQPPELHGYQCYGAVRRGREPDRRLRRGQRRRARAGAILGAEAVILSS